MYINTNKKSRRHCSYAIFMHYGFKYTSGGKGLVKLNKLEHLDLSSNNLTDTHILEFLATLPALKSLSLADNYMEQPLSDQGM